MTHPGDQRRRQTRAPVRGYGSTLGTILDVSESGLRIRRRGFMPVEPGEAFPIVLGTPLGSVAVLARMAWSRRVGWFTREAGFQFVALPPEAAHGIRALARACEQPMAA